MAATSPLSLLSQEERGSEGEKLLRTPESRKCEELCETQQSSQHFESLLGRERPGKVKLKTEVLGSRVCLELPEFAGFRLLLEPVLGRDSEHCAPLGTAQAWGCPGVGQEVPGWAGLQGRAGALRQRARAGRCEK